MSSRASRVDSLVTPFAWHAEYAVPQAPLPMPGFPYQQADPGPADIEPVPDIADVPGINEAPSLELQLAEVERAAFASGYAQGERAAADAAASQAHALLRTLAGTIEESAATRQDMIRRTERQVVELAMAIAKQMLHRELAADRGLLLGMARVALDGLGEQATATIRLHPADHALVTAAPGAAWTSGQVTVVADPVVGRGHCLVESDAGVMDVGIESQFNELARTLIGESSADTASR